MADTPQKAKHLRVKELEVGMTIADDVHSEDGSCLVQAGNELSSADIDRLKNWDIRRVKVQID